MKTMNLTLFGEGNGENAVQAPDAKGRSRAARFQQLIRGEFKTEFGRVVEGIVRRRLRAERAQLEALRAELAQQKELLRDYAAKQQAQRWQRELSQAQAAHPEFQLENELRDPAFAALLTRKENPLTICEAYEAMHFGELRARLEADAERRAMEALRARAARPTENGAAAQGGLPPAGGHLSRRERDRLAKRAARGEIISL